MCAGMPGGAAAPPVPHRPPSTPTHPLCRLLAPLQYGTCGDGPFIGHNNFFSSGAEGEEGINRARGALGTHSLLPHTHTPFARHPPSPCRSRSCFRAGRHLLGFVAVWMGILSHRRHGACARCPAPCSDRACVHRPCQRHTPSSPASPVSCHAQIVSGAVAERCQFRCERRGESARGGGGGCQVCLLACAFANHAASLPPLPPSAQCCSAYLIYTVCISAFICEWACLRGGGCARFARAPVPQHARDHHVHGHRTALPPPPPSTRTQTPWWCTGCGAMAAGSLRGAREQWLVWGGWRARACSAALPAGGPTACCARASIQPWSHACLLQG